MFHVNADFANRRREIGFFESGPKDKLSIFIFFQIKRVQLIKYTAKLGFFFKIDENGFAVILFTFAPKTLQ